MLASHQNEIPRALLHRSRDLLLEIKITLQWVQNSSLQRRLHADWLALEASQVILEPLEWLNRLESLRLEAADLYLRQPMPSAL